MKAAPVGVVGKVLTILEILDASSTGLALKDIASLAKLNKSTAHRLLAHLESTGYLVRDDGGAYMIGPKLVRMGNGANYQATLRSLSRPVLAELWHATGETVNLCVLDGREVLYVDVLESPHSFRLVSQTGMRRPLHCTALGKAILSWLPPERVNEYLASARFERTTPRALTNSAQLRKDLLESRSRGFAIDDEEAVTGARCISAAILDAGGNPSAAISISGPVVRIDRSRVGPFSALVKNAAKSISEKLGYTPPAGGGLAAGRRVKNPG